MMKIGEIETFSVHRVNGSNNVEIQKKTIIVVNRIVSADISLLLIFE